ncbi:MAG TPA: hypothetical protein VEZ90_08950 [Blastocatellia bacterium]|nr:hypothetical protein [Blastocatellia bacterium]
MAARLIQGVKAWVSAADIEAGQRWNDAINAELRDTTFGIICITPENQPHRGFSSRRAHLRKPSINVRGCPYLVGMKTADLQPGPLTQFQAKLANESDTEAILKAINAARGAEALPPDRLAKQVKLYRPELKTALESLPPARSDAPERTSERKLDELLDIARSISNRLPREPDGTEQFKKDFLSSTSYPYRRGSLLTEKLSSTCWPPERVDLI